VGAMITQITSGGDAPQFGQPGGHGGYPQQQAQPAYGGGGYGGYAQAQQQPAYGGYAQQQPAYGGGGYGGGYPQQQAQQQPAYGGYGHQQPGMQMPAGPPSGGAAWAPHQDTQGRTYYYNAATQQSQWEKPAGMA
jgi:hypothetical protein